MKVKYIKENIKYLLNDYRFKLIILFVICCNFFGAAYLARNSDYISAIMDIFTQEYYDVAFFALILVNTINTYDMFEKNSCYIIRFNNKKEYLIQLIKNILISNTILFIINLLVSLIFLNFFGNQFIIKKYDIYGISYNIPNLLYIVFYMFRFYIIVSIISLINACLIKLVNSKCAIFINVLLWIVFIFYPYNSHVINSISDIPLVFCSYFRVQFYSGFALESACSILYIFMLLIIGLVLFNIAKNRIKQIGE